MRWLKRLVTGTPLELPARRLAWRLMSDSDARARRDAFYIERLLDDALGPASNCIDVGANVGGFLERILHHAPRGSHVAVEPVPDLAARLSELHPDQTVINCALSDTPGTATFYHVPDNPAWSGFRKQDYPRGSTPREIEVTVRTLDDLVPHDRHVGFVKIDVEGAELEVLRGGSNLIGRCRPIILFEHALVHSQAYGTTPGQVFDLLVDECDMAISRLDRRLPMSRDRFCAVVEQSHRSHYDRHAHTNFVARRG